MSALLKMFNPDDSTDMTSTLNRKKWKMGEIVLSPYSLEELNRNTFLFLFLELKIVRFCSGGRTLKIFGGIEHKNPEKAVM